MVVNVEPIFPKWANKIPRYLAVGIPVTLAIAIGLIWYYFTPKFLQVGYQPEQPVPFSHQLHAGKLGMDCRYCHSKVEEEAYAQIPPTQTCMGCHNKVKKDSPRLTEVIKSYEKNISIPWIKIHKLPKYARFNHSAHLSVGVSCQKCHGRVDKMEVVRQVEPLSMGWCLDCHRHPNNKIGPKDQITNLPFAESLHLNSSGKRVSFEQTKLSPIKTFEAPTSDCGACHY
ncbi:MAG: cytochrome c family protein [Silvanigrellaceae bacterium]|nr:cytochrome c family protein [Silvanigrellaceae bacterium]